MSDCNCGYDIGHPQVTKHADHCTSRKIALLQAELAALREAIDQAIAVATQPMSGYSAGQMYKELLEAKDEQGN